MKTDKWFYKLFLLQSGMLAELIPGVDTLQFSYSAQVVKETEFHFDGIFTPVTDDPTVPIVFAEVQMQTDKNFYRRFFAEIFLYLKQYEVNRPWQGLLILPSRGYNVGEELPYRELLERRVTRFYLTDLRERQDLSPNLTLLQLLGTNKEESGEIGKELLENAETEPEFELRLSLIETILANKFPDLTKEMIMQLLDLKQTDITQSRFYQEIRTECLEEGLQEGLQKQAIAMVIRLLTRRLGELSEERVGQIRQLSVSQLEELAESLLDFRQISDLEAWLKDAEKSNDLKPQVDIQNGNQLDV
ncbi:Rpn family recombination-promoting nuclease/putative transposase [Cylindrospermopsis raciborskii]|jgi:predicted transposase/invertase (TIGR01784 family)|uniref:Rpn family recombination-promoting nuclease/putative transposase n=2 Tax=Cylindrospermopsis raciborskii TaxID=77022 RepID=UPI001F40274D|nr:Rpn family recombination-promoting nuclease/putative transposase [Cylindrospermopsis raciborskii]UJS05691.1 Rpn family recombination-promoting nuclease/putative transposase [Cylindrospermopsis raciborskii KLL07]